MANHNSTRALVLCCVFGAGSGVLSSWLYGEASGSLGPAMAQGPKQAEKPRVQSSALPAQASARDPRVSALEAKVLALSREREHGDDEPDEDRAALHDLPRLRAERERQWQDLLDSVKAEPVDPQFRDKGGRSFANNLSELAKEHRFSLAGVECHTTRCSASVRWPSFDLAAQRFAALLQHAYDINCSTHMLLPEPASTKAREPYVSTIVFDCGDAS